MRYVKVYWWALANPVISKNGDVESWDDESGPYEDYNDAIEEAAGFAMTTGRQAVVTDDHSGKVDKVVLPVPPGQSGKWWNESGGW